MPRREPEQPVITPVSLHLQGGPHAGYRAWHDHRLPSRVRVEDQNYYYCGYMADGMRCYMHSGLANMTPADFFHDDRSWDA